MQALDLRPAGTRGSLRADWLDARFSFSFGDYHHPARQGFSALRVLNEDVIQPGSGFPMHPHRNMEILMLPLSGAIAHADSLGHQAIVRPDEVLLMSAGAGIRHSQMNASQQSLDHHLQLWLRPRQRGTAPRIAHRHFERAGRQGRWQLIASPDGQHDSLRIDQDARVWRAALPSGCRLGFTPDAGRSVYLHMATGSARLHRPQPAADTTPLAAGDAVAWREGERFELAADHAEPTELLLFDLPPHTD
ncbi:pirin family protein [Ideonella sp. BN130291]|uniref:pirin family protein n=1 Tax=Ideonella sp. BN130291 TaxID=3112940 RepID=UPI002E25BA8D|nr:pirin family protein [Ideonella sp. BN130291]